MFDVYKYLGKWYELMHYPSWFQRNDNYNTTAEYSLTQDGIKVVNTTISNGKVISSEGLAKQLHDVYFRVDFSMSEVNKLINTKEFNINNVNINNINNANYVIDRLWLNQYGEYIFAVVTDEDRQSLYVLSRYKHPSLIAYNEVMAYVIKNFNRDLLVQTPHF